MLNIPAQAQVTVSPAQTTPAQAADAPASRKTLNAIRRAARPIRGVPGDYDALLEKIGDARLVLMGEDTHGSLEHYRERVRITQRLIEEKGFNGLVIESDWAASERVDRYVRGLPGDDSADKALAGHTRFPVWMWRNAPFRDLVEWLRHYAQTPSGRTRSIGVYGMDTQGLEPSARVVLETLARIDPATESRVREDYACLESYGYASDRYSAALKYSGAGSCEAGAASALAGLQERYASLAIGASSPAFQDEALWFSILQNAHLVHTAEAYARALAADSLAWNVRDSHMADAVDAVLARLQKMDGRPGRLVVWAHNTHIGDARAMDRGTRSGYWSVGQLLRERHPGETVLVGFTTRAGTVRAAPEWGKPDRVFNIRRPAWESAPAIFGRTHIPRFMLIFSDAETQLGALDNDVPMRAIGAVYSPKFERRDHYYRGALTRQFDAVIHTDITQAVPKLP
jgi:erythromycin esterase-like protein